MGLFDKLIKKQNQEEKPNEIFMISQYAAFYVYQGSEYHKNQYINKLVELKFNKNEAKKLLDFESDILRRFDKKYLLEPDFTKMWFFDLSQPFFKSFPNKKDEILKEHFLTVSEICKIIDEAEWHFWNSHEKVSSDEVWQEIFSWSMRGGGMGFGVKYFKMIAESTGIPEDKIADYSSNEGGHLNKYKWN